MHRSSHPISGFNPVIVWNIRVSSKNSAFFIITHYESIILEQIPAKSEYKYPIVSSWKPMCFSMFFVINCPKLVKYIPIISHQNILYIIYLMNIPWIEIPHFFSAIGAKPKSQELCSPTLLTNCPWKMIIPFVSHQKLMIFPQVVFLIFSQVPQTALKTGYTSNKSPNDSHCLGKMIIKLHEHALTINNIHSPLGFTDKPFMKTMGGFGPQGATAPRPGSRQSPPPGCCLSLPDAGAEGVAGAALGGVTRGGPGHRRAMEWIGMGIQMLSFGEAKTVNQEESGELELILMIYDDLWWFMMIYDDLWWCMMIYDDLWWFMCS